MRKEMEGKNISRDGFKLFQNMTFKHLYLMGVKIVPGSIPINHTTTTFWIL